jgi:O-antigen/teichoic acid export membrane protein
LIQLITLVSGVILARALRPEGRGILALAMIWPILVAAIGVLGIGDALVYRAAREGAGPSGALSSALLLGIPQSLLLAAIGWFVIQIVLRGKQIVSADADLYLLYIPLNLFILYTTAVLQGRMAMSPFNMIRASVHLSYTVFLALLWFSHHVDVRTALAASLLSNAITAALSAAAMVRGGLFAGQVSGREIRSLISLGLKLNLGNLASVITSRIDFVMLSLLVTPEILGDYVVATAVGALPLVIPSSISLILYPLFAGRDADQAKRPFARFMLLAILLMVATVPVVVVLNPLVVKVFFGNAFSAAFAPAQILGIASVLRGMSVMLSSVLRGLGAPIRASGGDALGLVVMAVLLTPAIRLGEAEGAAVAVLLGTATSVAWMIFHGMRVNGIGAADLVRLWEVDVRRNS